MKISIRVATDKLSRNAIKIPTLIIIDDDDGTDTIDAQGGIMGFAPLPRARIYLFFRRLPPANKYFFEGSPPSEKISVPPSANI